MHPSPLTRPALALQFLRQRARRLHERLKNLQGLYARGVVAEGDRAPGLGAGGQVPDSTDRGDEFLQRRLVFYLIIQQRRPAVLDLDVDEGLSSVAAPDQVLIFVLATLE